MKFSLTIPLGVITPGEFQTPQAVRAMAAALEEAGADACSVTDHPAPDAGWLHANGHDALDPFSALAFVAAASERLRLQTNIVVIGYRNPFIVAKAAATLHLLSGGRLILGTGAGYQKAEFEALGADFHRRGALFDEALELMRLAWAGGPVTFRGTHFHAENVEPRPALISPPPVWIGGNSDRAAERGARHGDGWCPFFAGPSMLKGNRAAAIQSVEHLSEKIERIGALRAELGRTGPFDVAIGPPISLGYGQPGGADAYLDGVEALREAGVTWISAAPPHGSRQHYLECVQWFGEEVIARLRRR